MHGGAGVDLNRIRKFTYTINTVIMFLVIGLAGFFYLCKATVLIWFSIPTFLVYVIGYLVIAKDRLDIYVRLVYFWITLYMCVCTYCLGYKIGFHLYCLSMIPIIFYTEYWQTSSEGPGSMRLSRAASSASVTCSPPAMQASTVLSMRSTMR